MKTRKLKDIEVSAVGMGCMAFSHGYVKIPSAQISLAWMLHKYPNVVPIPGSKNKERIIENLNAVGVELTDEEFKALDSELDKHKVYGHRGLGGF